MDFELIVLLVLLIAVIFAAFLYRRNNTNRDYDERQRLLRARADKLGYTTTLLLLLGLIILTDYHSIPYCSSSFCMFAVMMAGLTVSGVYCVITDSFFQVSSKKNYYIFLLLMLTLLYAFTAYRTIHDGSIWDHGVITFNTGHSIIMAIGFFIVTLSMIIRLFIRTEEDET